VFFKRARTYQGSVDLPWKPSQDDMDRFPRLLKLNPFYAISAYTYEEGRFYTYTRTVSGTGGSVGAFSISGTTGYWVFTNGTAWYYYGATINNVGSWTGTVQISLPFVVSAGGFLAGFFCANGANPYSAGRGIPVAVGTIMNFLSSANISNLQWAACANADVFSASGNVRIG
jgi:hypothetical protein